MACDCYRTTAVDAKSKNHRSIAIIENFLKAMFHRTIGDKTSDVRPAFLGLAKAMCAIHNCADISAVKIAYSLHLFLGNRECGKIFHVDDGEKKSASH